MNSLEQQIEKYKKEIHSDAYPMSIGECVNMYLDREIDIHPEFQRFYRWSLEQKSKFIESILLGIPIPSFFVAQRPDGIWDLVDGLQRFSTILSFMGELRDEKEEKLPPLTLSSGVYLKELAGATWSDECKDGGKISQAIRLSFRREKLDFKIIKKESTADTKYELFRRLNTGGSALSPQEVRNCLLLMTNKDFYSWIQALSRDHNFQSTIPLSEDQYDKQYNLELIVRFVVFCNLDWESVSSSTISDIGEFLNDHILELAADSKFDFAKNKKIFTQTFYLINRALGASAFKKFYPDESVHKGAFSIALYEAITTGIALNIGYVEQNYTGKKLKEAIEEFSQNEIFSAFSGSGIRTNTRAPKIVPAAINFFAS